MNETLQRLKQKIEDSAYDGTEWFSISKDPERYIDLLHTEIELLYAELEELRAGQENDLLRLGGE